MIMMAIYNNDHYYYITNLQGDIIAILNFSGSLVDEYEYDSWGNCTTIINKDRIASLDKIGRVLRG